MRLKENYDSAKIEVISFTATDILTTSGGENIETGSDNKTDDGWTPIGW